MTRLYPPKDHETESLFGQQQRERDLVYAIRTFQEAEDAYAAAGQAVDDALTRKNLARDTKTMASEILLKALRRGPAMYEGKLYRADGNHIIVEDCQLVIPLDRCRS